MEGFLKASGVLAVMIIFIGAIHQSVEGEKERRAEEVRLRGTVVINKIGEKGIIQYYRGGWYTVRDKDGWIVTWPDCEIERVE